MLRHNLYVENIRANWQEAWKKYGNVMGAELQAYHSLCEIWNTAGFSTDKRDGVTTVHLKNRKEPPMANLAYYYVPASCMLLERKQEQIYNLNLEEWVQIDVVDIRENGRGLWKNFFPYTDQMAEFLWDLKEPSESIFVKEQPHKKSGYKTEKIRDVDDLSEKMGFILSSYTCVFLFKTEVQTTKAVYISDGETVELFLQKYIVQKTEKAIEKWAEKTQYYTYELSLNTIDSLLISPRIRKTFFKQDISQWCIISILLERAGEHPFRRQYRETQKFLSTASQAAHLLWDIKKDKEQLLFKIAKKSLLRTEIIEVEVNNSDMLYDLLNEHFLGTNTYAILYQNQGCLTKAVIDAGDDILQIPVPKHWREELEEQISLHYACC